MERSEKFSDYLFAKMGPPIINGDATKTTDNCDAPVELTGFRKWLNQNFLLLMTLSGVLVGIIEGKQNVVFQSFCRENSSLTFYLDLENALFLTKIAVRN